MNDSLNCLIDWRSFLRRRRWSDTSSGTRSAKTLSSTGSWGTVRWTTAPRGSPFTAVTMESTPTTTVSRWGFVPHQLYPLTSFLWRWGLAQGALVVSVGKCYIQSTSISMYLIEVYSHAHGFSDQRTTRFIISVNEDRYMGVLITPDPLFLLPLFALHITMIFSFLVLGQLWS